MTNNQKEKPLYLGHRERLKERFLKDDGISMADYEFLELLLTFAIPRRDVKNDAKKLLNHFGSFKNLLTASETQLAEYGLSKNAIVLFKAVLASSKRISYARLKETTNTVFSHIDYVFDYCKTSLLQANVEEFHIMLLDKKLKLIKDQLIARGSVDEVPVYTREIVKYILDSNAVSIILYHNHPSGDCSPSYEDIHRTKEIVEALKPLNVKVYDHIIVSKDNYYSFHDHNLI